MPKTNHRREFRDDRKYPSPVVDRCRGKHGEQRAVAGLKKFGHSRHRLHERLACQQLLQLEDKDASLADIMQTSRFEGNYTLRKDHHPDKDVHPKRDANDEGYGPFSEAFMTQELGRVVVRRSRNGRAVEYRIQE